VDELFRLRDEEARLAAQIDALIQQLDQAVGPK
jgi:hypothetical protein